MDIEGNTARLNDEERRITGLPGEVALDALTMNALFACINARHDELNQQLSGASSFTDRGRLQYDRLDLVRDVKVVEQMAGQVLAHEVALSLNEG